MPKTILFLLALGLSFVTLAQKPVKIKCGEFQYVQPPADRQLQDYKTFELILNMPDHVPGTAEAKNFRSTAVSYSSLKGFDELADGTSGDFMVIYSAGAYKRSNPKQTSKDGKYTLKGTMDFNIEVVVKNKGENIYQRNYEGTSNVKVTADSPSKANSEYTKKVNHYRGSIWGKGVKMLNDSLNNQFCTLEKVLECEMFSIKGKKFDYTELNNSINQVKDILIANLSSKKLSDADTESCSKLNELIKSDLSSYDAEDNKSRIATETAAGLYFNLGVSNFITGHYEESFEGFKQAAELDKKISKKILDFIAASKTMSERT